MNLKNKKGFTLIELCLVIALLGILAATAIPIASFQQSQKTSLVALELLNNIRYAQTLSKMTSEPHGIRTTGAGSNPTGYEIYNVNTNLAVTSPVTHHDMAIALDSSNQNINFTKPYNVTFDSQGTPTAITGSNWITIQDSDNNAYQIEINKSGTAAFPDQVDLTK